MHSYDLYFVVSAIFFFHQNHLLVYNELFVSIAKADSSLDWLYAQEEMCGVAPDENNIY